MKDNWRLVAKKEPTRTSANPDRRVGSIPLMLLGKPSANPIPSVAYNK